MLIDNGFFFYFDNADYIRNDTKCPTRASYFHIPSWYLFRSYVLMVNDDNEGCAPYASRNRHVCVHITCLASHFLPLAFAGNSHATLPRDFHTTTFSTYYYLFIFLFVCLLMYRENEWMNEKTKFAPCSCIIITCASTRIHILFFVLLSFFFQLTPKAAS